MPKAAPRSVDLQLEIERIDLLFKQNVQGLLAALATSIGYLVVSWSVTDPTFLVIWSSCLWLSCLGRFALTLRWRHCRDQIVSKKACAKWERSVQLLILVSGFSWGAIAWKMPDEPINVQLVSTMVVVIMVAGALVAYSSSYLTMLLVSLPAMLFWDIALFRADGSVYHTLACVGVFATFLVLFAGRNVNRYIIRGLRLNVENAQLAERLESKVYSLEKAQEELRRTESLRREQSEAEASTRAKNVLLANASHEIRTPLAAINGFTDMLLQNQTLPEDVRADLRMILRNGKYLVSLVNDMLDLSKIENGQIYIQKSFVNPLSDIQDVAALMRPVIEGKGLRFETDFGPLPMRVQTDSTRLREILINLLTNASKFTDEGSIKLRARFDEKRSLVRMTITDTGIGISTAASKSLFRPFTRGETARVQRTPGSGLGLALSRNLARLLGGDLQLLSSIEGKGSEFEVTIAAGPGAAREFARQATSTVTEGANAPTADGEGEVRRDAGATDAPAASLIASAKAVMSPNLNGRNILVVDDSVDLQILMKRFLEKQGAHVDVRKNGQEAVDRVRDHVYDLVLMDIKMPVLDGYSATKEIRAHGYTQPIVAVTAHASTDDRERCYRSGFDSYVSKPVDFDHLVDDLSKFLSKPI